MLENTLKEKFQPKEATLAESYQQGYDNMKNAYVFTEEHNYSLNMLNELAQANPNMLAGVLLERVNLAIEKEKTAGAFGKTLGLINNKHQLYVSQSNNVIRQLENRISSMKKDVKLERTFLDEQITAMDSFLVSKGLLGEYIEYLKLEEKSDD